MSGTPSSQYLLNETPPELEHQRLRQLEADWNPTTTRHCERLGVRAGWRCLEVGAGAGGVASWLAERVGPSGHVLATDLNPRFLHSAGLPPHATVVQHDIEHDPLDEGSFDFVHCRLVLIHLKDPQRALRRMFTALRPGGVLLIEESTREIRAARGFPKFSDEISDRFDQTSRTIFAVLREAGMNVWLGQRIPAMLQALGAHALGAEEASHLIFGDTPGALTYTAAAVMLRDVVLSKGLISAEAIDAYRGAFSEPQFAFLSPAILSVWGQRPT